MLCVYVGKRGQARDDQGRIRTYTRGTVDEFKECPPGFKPVKGQGSEESEKPLDFLTASEAELKAANWTFDEAFTSVYAEFGIELKKGKKDKVVDQILDARYRSVDSSESTPAR